jgi:hypothetical protein
MFEFVKALTDWLALVISRTVSLDFCDPIALREEGVDADAPLGILRRGQGGQREAN